MTVYITYLARIATEFSLVWNVKNVKAEIRVEARLPGVLIRLSAGMMLMVSFKVNVRCSPHSSNSLFSRTNTTPHNW